MKYVPPGKWINPLSSISPLYTLPAYYSPSTHLGYQTINCLSITVLVFKWPLFYLIMAPKYKNSDAGNSDILLLCLIKLYYRLYVQKKHSIYSIWYYSRFQASTGALGKYTPWIKGGYCRIKCSNLLWLNIFVMFYLYKNKHTNWN